MFFHFIMRDKDGSIVEEGTCDHTEKGQIVFYAKLKGYTIELSIMNDDGTISEETKIM